MSDIFLMSDVMMSDFFYAEMTYFIILIVGENTQQWRQPIKINCW